MLQSAREGRRLFLKDGPREAVVEASGPEAALAEAFARVEATFAEAGEAGDGPLADALAARLPGAGLTKAVVIVGAVKALYLTPGPRLVIKVPGIAEDAMISARAGVGGMASAGWRGRAGSAGIADAVTVLAASAAAAEAAAVEIADAVIVEAEGILTAPLQGRLVTRAVPELTEAARTTALASGRARAEALLAAGRIASATLVLQGRAVQVGRPVEL
ncbi:hypothetical protein [Pseudoroseicyclus sp. CXY001]|uniref:hypothetical protein n=1 Tax=Pseudoroseicyclus sp. CXY001 TaxID=3242492 RepID=UPI0035713FDC